LYATAFFGMTELLFLLILILLILLAISLEVPDPDPYRIETTRAKTTGKQARSANWV
jgi:predicted lipid-binding transport protein (Tim44 family)